MIGLEEDQEISAEAAKRMSYVAKQAADHIQI